MKTRYIGFMSPLRPIVLTLLCLCTTSANAAGCVYWSAGGDRLEYLSPVSFQVTFGEQVYDCDTSSGGTGVLARMAHCENGYESPIVPATSVRGGSDYDLLVFRDEIWYAVCV